jgi:hypothetical protein
MDKNIADLLELIKAHPELPIVPMVDSEIVCDDYYARWRGSWGAASVTKYLVSEEHIFFFDDDDVEAVLSEVKGEDELASMTDKEAQEAYNALPWVECIAVDINLP